MMQSQDPLAQLRDIALPQASWLDWWPPAIGWWLLLVLLALVVLLWYKQRRRMQRLQWLQEAQGEIAEIQNLLRQGCQHNARVLAQSSALLRRLAIYREGRQAVAHLTGPAWMNKLDQLSGSRDFTRGTGQVLQDHTWQKPEQLQGLDLSALPTVLSRFLEGCQKNQAREVKQ